MFERNVTRKENLVIRLTKEEKAKLKEVADKLNMSVSDLVRDMIAEELSFTNKYK